MAIKLAACTKQQNRCNVNLGGPFWIFYLEWLYKSVEQDSDTDTSSEKLDKPGSSEQFEKPNRNHLGGINDTAHNCDEVECVPWILEVIL